MLYGGTSTLPDAVKTLVYDGSTWAPVTTPTHPAHEPYRWSHQF